VIAIIAILAAMLFPVFARARESARKIQCLSNVKNIAMAVQIYLSDYDRFPPKEHRAEVRSFITDFCQKPCPDNAADCRATEANPYLRWPVILEEYVKNRDVWRCPSARFVKTFGVNWGYGTGDWFRYFKDHSEFLGCSPAVCSDPFPPGWGGNLTDSLGEQGGCGGPDTGGFDQSIGYPRTLYDMKTAQIGDPGKRVVVADSGPTVNALDRTSWVAYPDTCRIDSVACTDSTWHCGADWVNCSWTQDCGAGIGVVQFATDPTYRKQYAKSRHMGGSNLGYADGHAAWMASEAILFGGENWSGYADGSNRIEGLGVCINPNVQ